MRISLNWLNDYIPVKDIPVSDLATALTDIGLEVETIERVSPLKGDVVVGEILKAEPHPDADKLRVCQVTTGSGEPLNIVCGAPNAHTGIKVCVAKVGSVLPGDFKIKKSKIRGVPSFGMLCAQDELGLGADHDGIIELPPDTPLGQSIAELYRLNDTIFELGITPNRADCFGVYGVARDLAAKLELPLEAPFVDPSIGDESVSTKSQVHVDIEAPEDCARFCALLIDGLKVVPSPSWLQRRLEAAGMRPINLIVDVTNYVMLEFSQPIHAYDVRDVSGKSFHIRRAKAGEQLQTLDEQVHKLTPDDLLICDAQKPIGLAGIMGGMNSEVRDDTSTILVEVANFHPRLVRKTSKRLGLHTEASHRFERGTDVENCATVAQRVGQLLVDCYQELAADGVRPTVANDLVDRYPSPPSPARIAIRRSRTQQVLGLATLESKTISNCLERLCFRPLDETEDGERLLFEIPSWRHDIFREIDLIEEVGRIVGFDSIPKTLPMMEIAGLAEKPHWQKYDMARRALAQLGCHETISFPFVEQKEIEGLRIGSNHPLSATIELANPLSEDQRYLQPCLLPGLLKAIDQNRRHGKTGTRIFELGRGYLKSTSEPKGYYQHLAATPLHLTGKATDDHRVIEHQYLTLVMDQPWQASSWSVSEETEANFFHGKGIAEAWLTSLGIRNYSFQTSTADDLPFLHPRAAATISVGETIVGYLGELHPETSGAFGLPITPAPIVLEFALENIVTLKGGTVDYERGDCKFPPAARDLAIVVDRDLSFAAVEKALRTFPRKRNLTSFRLFDVYMGENVASDKKSLALALSFQSQKRTLNDKEVEGEVDQLLKYLSSELDATLR